MEALTGPFKLRVLYELYINAVRINEVKLDDIKVTMKLASEKRANKYLRALNWIIKEFGAKEMDYNAFKNMLLNYLNEKYKLSNIIKVMAERKLAVNHHNFQKIALEQGLKISKRLAKSLIHLARELEILSILFVAEYTPSIQDRILVYLKNKGEIKYFRLENRFPGTEEIILELWRRGLVEIDVLEPIRERLRGVDLRRIPIELIGDYVELFSIWEDPVSGERYGTIVIPSNALVKIR